MLRLHLGLLAAKFDSSVLAFESDREWPEVRRLVPSSSGVARLRRRLLRTLGHGRIRPPSARHDAFSDGRTVYGTELTRQFPAGSIAHLHWVTKFVDAARFLGKLHSPAVWTLHDMSPFTGGCHYSEGCNRFEGHCGLCPQLDSRRIRDAATYNQNRKAGIHRAVPPGTLFIVAPSTWMAHHARRSTVLRPYATEVIPYGVDLTVFQPSDQKIARQQLGIPINSSVLLFCADYPTPRKGFSQFLNLVEQLRTLPDLVILSVGNGAPSIELPVTHRRLGQINDDHQMARAYAAADIFLIPSLEDNQPNTILESMACGTPVVGFSTGGIPEAIDDAGISVPLHDIAALAAAVQTLLSDRSRRQQLGRAARTRAEKNYSISLQAARYIELYKQLLITHSQESFRP